MCARVYTFVRVRTVRVYAGGVSHTRTGRREDGMGMTRYRVCLCRRRPFARAGPRGGAVAVFFGFF